MRSLNRIKKLTQKLWRKNSLQPVGSQAVSVYFYLLWQLKKQKTDPIAVSDSEIASQLKIRRNTVRVCREKLKNSGLVDFCISKGHKTQYTFGNSFEPAASKTSKSTIICEQIRSPKNQVVSHSDSVTPQVEVSFPEFSEVLVFVKTLSGYNDQMEPALSERYASWVSNGWKNAFGKSITNWQQTVKNALPYLGRELPSKENLTNIPQINRPDKKLT